MAEFNLGGIFKAAFGYDAPKDAFTIEEFAGRKNQSDLGQPYYASDLSGREFFLPVTLNGYLIPFAVIGLTCKKTIVSTAMPERGGSVKELISIDDYDFNIKGILINNDNSYPESLIRDIHKLFVINASVSMRSVLSDIVLNGIKDHRVVIKDLKFPPVAGIEHAKPFEMTLESDMILDLNID